MPFIMSQNLQRISVSVDKEEYEELKKHTRAGISIGFLIRESIHQYLEKNKKNLSLEYLPFSIKKSYFSTIFLQC